MTIRLLQTLIVILFAFQAWVQIPYELIRPGCFDDKYDRYPQWFDFPDERVRSLERCTRSGTSIGTFHRPREDRAGALWNERWDNRVVTLVDMSDIADCDYLYLRSDLDKGLIDHLYANRHLFDYDKPSTIQLIYLDNWGLLYGVD